MWIRTEQMKNQQEVVNMKNFLIKILEYQRNNFDGNKFRCYNHFITIKKTYMTRPFQYDSYVKSQIGIQNDYEPLNKSHLRSTVQKHEGPFYHPSTFENVNQVSSRASLRNKINELLGLCQDQNKNIKGEFREVMGAQNDILSLLKQEAARQHTPNNYVNSHVQNFPRNPQDLPGQSRFGDPNLNEYNQSGQYDQYGDHGQPYNPQPGVPEYQDRTQFLKSKVQQLKEENKFLKYQTSQVARPEDDQEIRYLQQEIQRLRTLLPQYEAEINRLREGGQSSKLLQLLEQGQRIRQDTLSLLKNNGNNSYEDTPSKNQILNQLDSLRANCKELEQQNMRLKRTSKGTDFTSFSRGYYR